MKSFSPVAIIGQGCVYPDANSPKALFENLLNQKVSLYEATEEEWKADFSSLLERGDAFTPGKIKHTRRGTVRDFQPSYHPGDFPDFNSLGNVFQWTLHAVNQAFQSVGMSKESDLSSCGLILGNLLYSTEEYYELLVEMYLEDIVDQKERTHPFNRFMGGLPAMEVARVFGMDRKVFTLDAACASSLYALKYACDELQTGRADMMVAAGVSASDELFLSKGFTALGGLSPTGRSRPFDQEADGLMHAQGAGAVILKRLSDAVKDQDPILGVVRGIGLSNDGKSGGFLSPSMDGQMLAMEEAIQCSGLHRDQVSFIECHATGTPKGDPVELQSIQKVYGDRKLYLGSIKGNLGHILTASGMAGILKVINGFSKQTLAGTPSLEKEHEILAESKFEVNKAPIAWEGQNKVAAISNFGFGGNNAHVILQEWNENNEDIDAILAAPAEEEVKERVAVVGLDIRTPQVDHAGQFYFGNGKEDGVLEHVRFDINKLGFPPKDLEQATGQQLLPFSSVQKVLDGKHIDTKRTGIFVGIGVQEVSGHQVFENRIPWFLKKHGITPSPDWMEKVGEAIDPLLEGLVLGTMPNIPANRLNNYFDIQGEGFSVTCEELSGNKALDVAMDAIERGRLSAAIVCAADIEEPSLRKSLNKEVQSGVVTLLLKSESMANKDGDTILTYVQSSEAAVIDEESTEPIPVPVMHSAEGLRNIAGHIMAQSTQTTWKGGQFQYHVEGPRPIAVTSASTFGAQHQITLVPPDRPIDQAGDWAVYTFAGESVEGIKNYLRNGQVSHQGASRLAILSKKEDIQELMAELLELPEERWQNGWVLPNAYFQDQPEEGEVAFIYTGAAASYKEVAKDLMKAYPSLLFEIGNKNEQLLKEAIDWIHSEEELHDPAKKLVSGTIMSRFHTLFSTEILKIRPDAALGLSAGETNSLLSLDVIQDQQSFISELMEAGFYQKYMSVTFDAVKTYWDTDEPIQWSQWVVFDDVQPFLEETKNSDKVFVTMVHSDDNFVLSGDVSACESLIKKLNPTFYKSINFDFAIHTPAVKPIEELWRKVHTRKKINPRKDIRFYSEHFGGAYTPTAKKVGEALTSMALNQLDLRKIVTKAWEDGVRVFIEQGPGNNMTQFVGQILKDKPHHAISFDSYGKNSLYQAQLGAAQLWAMHLAELPELMLGKIQAPVFEMAFRVGSPEVKIPPIEGKGTVPIAEGDQAGHIMRPPTPADYLTFQFEDFDLQEDSYEKKNSRENGQGQTFEPVREMSPATPAPEQKESSPVHDQSLTTETTNTMEEGSLVAAHYNQIVENRSAFMQFMNQSHHNYLTSMSNMLKVIESQEGTGADFTPEILPSYAAQAVSPPKNGPIVPSIQKPNGLSGNGHVKAPKKESEETTNELPGPKFDRAQLEELASGKISNVFGPLFKQQDHYDIQVRMPEPPMLLCDRVTGIQGEAGTMSTGIMWTESDVKEDSWFLHNNRMPPGILIESGQADLLLVSWMGVDFLQNKGERAYRLLGCELTFHGEMPRPGDTLKYEIHLDGYSNLGDVSLFFFHYDCHIDGKLRISVRNGQAGFFTKQELTDSGGVLWTPEEATYTPNEQPLDLSRASKKRSFTLADVQAYQEGDLVSCFGPSFYMTQPHTRTPLPASDQMNFIHKVPVLDFKGGPTGRGYLRSVWEVSPDDWFFSGHFKNDQCMPGTLMADACLQMMGFYMVAAGLTQNKDGWRFQPVSEAPCQFICRGQVTPASKKIDYELFIDEVIMEPFPTVYAHVLATVDDRLKIFMCERMALELVPDFPITSMKSLLEPEVFRQGAVARLGEFPYDYASLINCALGNPKDAFGAMYEEVDLTVPCPRLPGPPYHFMSRVLHLDGKPGDYSCNPTVKVAYDISPKAWYFEDNLNGVMPYSVLLEIALQPCGWLSTYAIIDEIKNKHLLFRNLDGKATQHFNVTPSHQIIETTAQLVNTSVLGETIIVNFQISCRVDGELFYEVETVFGFFSPESMRDQKGHTIETEEQQRLDLSSNISRSFRSTSEPNALSLAAKDQLLMIDRMDYFNPKGGKHGKGYIRGEKDVHPTDWYFKAHFYLDPVQPGSLGIEALLQLIQAYLLETHPELKAAEVSFEPVALARENEWHYRGQVVPENERVVLDFDVETMESSGEEVWVEGEGRLWVNGLKIYHCPKIGVRMKR